MTDEDNKNIPLLPFCFSKMEGGARGGRQLYLIKNSVIIGFGYFTKAF
jgi:hypothetical protein